MNSGHNRETDELSDWDNEIPVYPKDSQHKCSRLKCIKLNKLRILKRFGIEKIKVLSLLYKKQLR